MTVGAAVLGCWCVGQCVGQCGKAVDSPVVKDPGCRGRWHQLLAVCGVGQARDGDAGDRLKREQ